MTKSKMKNQTTATIVNGMLATAPTKKALALTAIKNLTAKVNDAEKQRFMNSLELAQMLAQTKTQFEDFCKAVINKLKDGGTPAKDLPKKDELIKLVYGFQKSFYYKLIKVGELPKNVVNKFIDKCDEAEKDGKDFARSIEALNTWAKNFETHKGEADADAESISDLRDGGERRETLWGIKSGKLKLNFFSDGTSETNFTDAEINALLVEITAHIKSKYAEKKTTPKQREKLDAVQREKKPVAVNKLLK
jgi:hypothetical protein